MELSLSLNNLKFANVMDFSRSFGIKKTSSQNGGSNRAGLRIPHAERQQRF